MLRLLASGSYVGRNHRLPLMDTTTINALPISFNVLIAFIARSSWATTNPHRDRWSATTVQPDHAGSQ
jgi:hypothetical protein